MAARAYSPDQWPQPQAACFALPLEVRTQIFDYAAREPAASTGLMALARSCRQGRADVLHFIHDRPEGAVLKDWLASNAVAEDWQQRAWQVEARVSEIRMGFRKSAKTFARKLNLCKKKFEDYAAVCIPFGRKLDMEKARIVLSSVRNKPVKLDARGIGWTRVFAEVLPLLAAVHYSCLLFLDLADNGPLDEQPATMLVHALKRLRNVFSIDLSGACLLPQGCELMRLKEESRHEQLLDACYSVLPEQIVSDLGLLRALEGDDLVLQPLLDLVRMPSLHRLYLAATGCNLATARAIAPEVKKHPSLERLDLRDNAMHPEGTMEMLNAVQCADYNPRIRSVRLQANLYGFPCDAVLDTLNSSHAALTLAPRHPADRRNLYDEYPCEVDGDARFGPCSWETTAIYCDAWATNAYL